MADNDLRKKLFASREILLKKKKKYLQAIICGKLDKYVVKLVLKIFSMVCFKASD